MVIIFLMLFLFLAYVVIKRKKYLLGVISVASVMLLFAALILFFPKTINRFESIKNMKFNFENTNTINHFNMEVDSANWNGLTTRLAIWQCASQSISENVLIGSGVGDYKDDLHEKFKENNFYFGLEKEFETHNNYLHVILMFGLIGFIVFSIYLFLPLILAIRKQNFIYIAFLVIFIISFLTEDALSRNQGIMLFALFNSIFAFNLKLNKSN
jgi:O-antigen ligase